MADMAETRKTWKPTKRSHRSHSSRPQKKPEKAPSWEALRLMFSCKDQRFEGDKRKKCVRSGCSVSLCSIKESSKIMVKSRTPPGCTRKSVSMAKVPLNEVDGPLSSSSSISYAHSHHSPSSATTATANSFRGLHLRRFSGCYECHTLMNPVNGGPRNPSLRSTICTCPECGEMFLKPDDLELHRAVKHAVSELGPEDTSRNIVEIIFQSSWLKKRAPPCRIDRILKVNNTRKTIDRFEDYRDGIRSKATKLSKKYPRCIADGNELLRFHCTSFMCSVGTNGSTALCHSAPHCKLCSILRDGFKADASGRVQTMATSGRAHDVADVSPEDEKRAMLVCRVIAGRVKKTVDATTEEYDSVCSTIGRYSNLDKLFVFNHTAILPCFLVIYRTS